MATGIIKVDYGTITGGGGFNVLYSDTPTIPARGTYDLGIKSDAFVTYAYNANGADQSISQYENGTMTVIAPNNQYTFSILSNGNIAITSPFNSAIATTVYVWGQ